MSELEFYDVVLELKSLSKLTDGFPIIYTEKGKEKIDKVKNEDGCVITAIGNSNQGKSFILSRISEMDIPSGHSISTRGLSIVFPDNLKQKGSNQRFIILDTEGSQNAITISDEDRKKIYELNEMEKIEKIEATSRDKQMTENFLQSFALNSSHIVIAVVGQLTFQDQKFLNRIKDVCKNKNLFIIHNLMFLEKRQEVEEHMKDVIESSLFFNLEKQKMIHFGSGNKNEEEKKENDDTVKYIYVESSESSSPHKKKSHIIHLILAKEGSEAGNFFNEPTIKYLRDSVISITQQQKFDIIKKFSKYLCLYAGEYFDIPRLDDKQVDSGQLISKENIEIIDNQFKVNVTFPLKLKKCYTDEIGLTSYKGLMTTPPFGYFKQGDSFTIQIEYCGELKNYKVKKNILNGQYKFTIIGETKKTENKPIISNIEEGNFILSFSVGLDFITISSNEYKEINDEKNGVLNIVYNLSTMNVDENEQELGDDDNW